MKGVAPGKATVRAHIGRVSAKISVGVADKPAEVSVNFGQDLLSNSPRNRATTRAVTGRLRGRTASNSRCSAMIHKRIIR